MQANWSLVLNALLLIGVIVSIRRMMKAKRESLKANHFSPLVSPSEEKYDDIIAVRKIALEEEEPIISPSIRVEPEPTTFEEEEVITEVYTKPMSSPRLAEDDVPASRQHLHSLDSSAETSLVLFLLAKENRQLAGYELLQTVLAAGLRFGDGHLFHRHQFPNGQGPVLCSLAAATPTGVFDLQNIGAFSVRGLCLFMRTSGNATIDGERFTIMLDTAKQLSEGLDTYLLDDKRQPLTETRIERYYQSLNSARVLEPEAVI